jgi:nucleoid-associated protein YgaU
MAPRGIRNNNPGNIEYGKFARSMGATGSDGRFAKFPTPEQGIKALGALQKRYEDDGLLTVTQRISRWAPASENNVTAYANAVAKKMGIDPNTPFSINDPKLGPAFVEGMIQHENGSQPYTKTQLAAVDPAYGVPTPRIRPESAFAQAPDPAAMTERSVATADGDFIPAPGVDIDYAMDDSAEYGRGSMSPGPGGAVGIDLLTVPGFQRPTERPSVIGDRPYMEEDSQAGRYGGPMPPDARRLAPGYGIDALPAARALTPVQRKVAVQRGDTLWDIAKRELGDGNRYRELAKANSISNPKSIKPGQLIAIPGVMDQIPTPPMRPGGPNFDNATPDPVPSRVGDLSAAMGGPPQPAPMPPPPVDPRLEMPAPPNRGVLGSGSQVYGGPPALNPYSPMVGGREEFPGALPPAPRSGDMSAAMGPIPTPARSPTASGDSGVLAADQAFSRKWQELNTGALRPQASPPLAQGMSAAMGGPPQPWSTTVAGREEFPGSMPAAPPPAPPSGPAQNGYQRYLTPPNPPSSHDALTQRMQELEATPQQYTGAGGAFPRVSSGAGPVGNTAVSPGVNPPSRDFTLNQDAYDYNSGANYGLIPGSGSQSYGIGLPPQNDTISGGYGNNRIIGADQGNMQLPDTLNSFNPSDGVATQAKSGLAHMGMNALSNPSLGPYMANQYMAAQPTAPAPATPIAAPPATGAPPPDMRDTTLPRWTEIGAVYGEPPPGTVPATGPEEEYEATPAYAPRVRPTAPPAARPMGGPAPRGTFPGMPSALQRVVSPQGRGIMGGIAKLLSGGNQAMFQPAGNGLLTQMGNGGVLGTFRGSGPGWSHGTTNAAGGTNALSWNNSQGTGSVTVAQDPWTGTYYGPSYSTSTW